MSHIEVGTFRMAVPGARCTCAEPECVVVSCEARLRVWPAVLYARDGSPGSPAESEVESVRLIGEPECDECGAQLPEHAAAAAAHLAAVGVPDEAYDADWSAECYEEDDRDDCDE